MHRPVRFTYTFFLSSKYGQIYFNKLKTADYGCRRAGSAEDITKMPKYRTVVLIKIEMDISGSSWKGRPPVSPELVEYLRYSLR